MRWLVSVLGVVVIVLSLYWSINPPLAEVNGLLTGGIVFLIGLMLIVAGYWWHRRSKESQTVTIALGDQAEQDAAILDRLQSAVSHHENPDKVVPKQAQKRVSDDKFIQLPKDERKLRRVKR